MEPEELQQFFSKYFLDFGKYCGKNLDEVLLENPQYIFWAIENTDRIPKKYVKVLKEISEC